MSGMYEAMRTHGNVGNLPELLQGSVSYLDYFTLRHRGHYAAIKTLLNLATPSEAVSIISRNASRRRDAVVYKVQVDGKQTCGEIAATGGMSALGLATSAGICAIARMVARGGICGAGFIPVETVDYGHLCSELANLGVVLTALAD